MFINKIKTNNNYKTIYKQLMLSKHCCEMNSLRKTDLKKNFNLARTTTDDDNRKAIPM